MGNLAKHKREVHEEVKYSCGRVVYNFLKREVLLNTKRHFRKESDITVGNAANNSLRGEVLLNTNEQYIKEANCLEVTATIK